MSKPTLTLPLGDNLSSSLGVVRDAYSARIALPAGAAPPELPPEPEPTDKEVAALCIHYVAAVIAAHPEAVCREARTDPQFREGTHPGIRCGMAAAQLMAAGKEHVTFIRSLMAARQRPRSGLVDAANRPIEAAAGPALLVPAHLAGRKA
ncbi:hypothetical protein [Zavarzinia sp.]|uniref:hypothetical protein n=1 Tax=Zavarzinia sp. TaxID=2027920 RepID=UPI003564B639